VGQRSCQRLTHHYRPQPLNDLDRLQFPVPNTSTKPICPNCGYDLSGLIAPKKTATCPECSTESSYQAATESQSRWNAIKWYIILLLVIPMILNTASYFLLDPTNDTMLKLGFFPVVMLPLVILVATPIFLHDEWRTRRLSTRKPLSPPDYVSGFFIVGPAIVSFLVSLFMALAWTLTFAGP